MNSLYVTLSTVNSPQTLELLVIDPFSMGKKEGLEITDTILFYTGRSNVMLILPLAYEWAQIVRSESARLSLILRTELKAY